MRFGVLIDSSYGAPPRMRTDARARLVPIYVYFGDKSVLDTAPLTREETSAFVLNNLVTQFARKLEQKWMKNAYGSFVCSGLNTRRSLTPAKHGK
jgi:hypothetical protein